MKMLCVGFCVWTTALAWHADAGERTIVIDCPAIHLDRDDRGRSVESPPSPVIAIVVGTIPKAPGPKGANTNTELTVKETLFGPHFSKIPLRDIADLTDSSPKIYCLSFPNRGQQPEFRLTVSPKFEGDRVFPLAELDAVKAMAQAQMDVLVLGCESIFIGRPVESQPDDQGSDANPGQTEGRVYPNGHIDLRAAPLPVKVTRMIKGDGPQPGETALVRGENNPLPPGEEFLYFADRGVPWQRKPSTNEYWLLRRWPASEAARVDEALKRVSLFPVRETVDPFGQKQLRRAITFQGSRGEAIALLGSNYDSARSLGAHRLKVEGDAAIPDVAAAVKANLFSKTSESLNGFEHQMRLIELLARMEKRRTDGEVVGLINLMLDEVQKGADFPANLSKRNNEKKVSNRLAKRRHPAARSSIAVGSMDDDEFTIYGRLSTKMNHSLAWLLLALEEDDTTRLFGERILKLRDLSAYGWLHELQSVVDRMHVEDHLELTALGLPKQTPSSWRAGFSTNGLAHYVVAFSHDDQYLGTVDSHGGKIWNTADWSLAGEYSQWGTVYEVAFSPDNQFLYVCGGDRAGTITRRNWRTNEIVQKYVGHPLTVTRMTLSPDGTRMLSSGNPGNSTMLWNTESGKILYRDDQQNFDAFVLHPRENWFLGKNREKRWVKVDVESGQTSVIDIDLITAKFSSDANTIYCLEHTRENIPTLEEEESARVLERLERLEKQHEEQTNPGAKKTARQAQGSRRPQALASRLTRRDASDLAIQTERTLDFAGEALSLTNDDQRMVISGADQVEVVSLPDLTVQSRSNLAGMEAREPRIDPQPPTVSHDGRWLIPKQTRIFQELEVYDVATGQRIHLGAGHSGSVKELNFIDSDQQLETRSVDGVVCMWDVNTGKLVERRGTPQSIDKGQHGRGRESNQPYISEDGSKAYSIEYAAREQSYGYYGSIVTYKIEWVDQTGMEKPSTRARPVGRVVKPKVHRLGTVDVLRSQVENVGLVPDGKHLFIGSNIFRRDDLELVSGPNLSGEVEQIRFSADGKRYVVATKVSSSHPPTDDRIGHPAAEKYRVRVHETQTGRTLWAVEVASLEPTCIALSQNGDTVAIVGKDSQAQVWRIGDQ